MIQSLHSHFEDLPALEKQVVNEICERFEGLLQEGADDRAEDHLGCISGQLRNVLFRELMLLECSYRFRAIDVPTENAPDSSFRPDGELARGILDRCAMGSDESATKLHAIPWQEHAEYLQRDGRFRVLRRIGSGGFGVVYEAKAQNGVVAVKVPLAGVSVSEEFKERFFREGRAMSCLDHPNIAKIVGVGTVGPLCYIASELVAGLQLGDWFRKKKGNLAVHEAVTLVLKLARALGYAHRAGVLHCDLKPNNVLVTHEESEPKIVDFGLAQLVDEPTSISRDGQILGTPLYMAPEQAAGRRLQLDAATDVHALGVILFELLTGQTPIEPGPIEQVLWHVRFTEAPRIRKKKPGISATLEAICLKCLEKQPRKRYANGNELADDLDRFISGLPTVARPGGPLTHANKWVRSHPRLMAIVTAMLLAAMVSATGWHEAVVARQETVRQLILVAAGDSENRLLLQKESVARGEAENNARLATDLVSQLLPRWESVRFDENLESHAKLRQNLETWRSLAKEHLASHPSDHGTLLMLAQVGQALSGLYLEVGKGDAARQAELETISILKGPTFSTDTETTLHSLSRARLAVATICREHGLFAEALCHFQEAEAGFRELAASHSNTRYSIDLATCRQWLAECLKRMGRLKDANKFLMANHALLEGLVHDAPRDTERRKMLFDALMGLNLLDEACQQARERTVLIPSDWISRWEFANCLVRIAKRDNKKDGFRQALPLLEEVLSKVQTEVARHPGNVSLPLSVPEICLFLMECHEHLGNSQAAMEAGKHGYESFRAFAENHPDSAALTGYHVELLTKLPRSTWSAGDHEAALIQVHETVKLVLHLTEMQKDRLAGPGPLFNVLLELISVQREFGDFDGADALAERLRRDAEARIRDMPQDYRSASLLASIWTRISQNEMQKRNATGRLKALREAVSWQQMAYDLALPEERDRTGLDNRLRRLGTALAEQCFWSEAAVTYMERERIWDNDTTGLEMVAKDIHELSEKLLKADCNQVDRRLSQHLQQEHDRIKRRVSSLGESKSSN